ncbi:hypothetical protein ACHAWF_001113, partial [Thalassiosira exigua]
MKTPKGDSKHKPSPNEEWPEVTADRTGSDGGTAVMFTKPFAQPKPKVEFDIKSASVDDLKSLRKRDPFLYYSIPG